MYGGPLRPPVQKLVATIMYSSPISSTKRTPSFRMEFFFYLVSGRTRTHLNADVRWTSAATSSKTGGNRHFRPFRGENANRARPPAHNRCKMQTRCSEYLESEAYLQANIFAHSGAKMQIEPGHRLSAIEQPQKFQILVYRAVGTN